MSDLTQSLKLWRAWVLLGWMDFKSRYHRSFFGPLWISVSYCAFIFVKIFIFSGFNLGVDPNVITSWIVLGFMVWTYIVNVLNGSADMLVISRGWILGDDVPYTVFVLQNTVSSLLNLVFVYIAALLISSYYVAFSLGQLGLSLSGLLLLIFCLFWAQVCLALTCFILRDLRHLVQTIIRLAFFLTPILWMPEVLGSRQFIATYNPFTHLIELVRGPLIFGKIETVSIIVVMCMTLVFFITAICLLNALRRRLALYA